MYHHFIGHINRSLPLFFFLVVLEAAQSLNAPLLLQFDTDVSPLDVLPSQVLVDHLEKLLVERAFAALEILVISLFGESNSRQSESLGIVVIYLNNVLHFKSSYFRWVSV